MILNGKYTAEPYMLLAIIDPTELSIEKYTYSALDSHRLGVPTYLSTEACTSSYICHCRGKSRSVCYDHALCRSYRFCISDYKSSHDVSYWSKRQSVVAIVCTCQNAMPTF